MDNVIGKMEMEGLREDIRSLTGAVLTLATQAVGSGQCSGVTMLNSVDAIKAIHSMIVNRLEGRK